MLVGFNETLIHQHLPKVFLNLVSIISFKMCSATAELFAPAKNCMPFLGMCTAKAETTAVMPSSAEDDKNFMDFFGRSTRPKHYNRDRFFCYLADLFFHYGTDLGQIILPSNS